MARLPRLVVPGQLHLLVQRGHNRQPVFDTDADYRAYIDAMRECALTHKVGLHAYALVPNAVHLLVTPADADGMSRMMQALGRRYAGWYNRSHGRSGALWDGRFRAGLIEASSHLLQATVLVESQPQRAGAVPDAALWGWSSLPHHLGRRNDAAVADHPLFWSLGNTPFDREMAYRRLFEQGLSAAEARQLEETADKGWALGSAAFLSMLAGQLERPIQPRPRGRPRKIDSVPD